ncbi:MAG: hypothetical protein ACRD34_12415, partial [Bryobacteraceae bacterium]
RQIPAEQRQDAPPVVLNPAAPMMEAAGKVATVLRHPLLPLMGAGFAQHPAGGAGFMEPVPVQNEARATASSTKAAKPQEPKASAAQPGSASGYVRLQVLEDHGKLSIVGAKQVAGPLTMPSAVIHGYVYEVLVDGQQVALGSLPDVGVMRAFANRDVEGPQGKHHFATLPTFEFAVRIPAGHVFTANLPKLNIVLYNVQEAPDRLTTLAPLARQPGVKAEEVGRLAGIRVEQLAPNVRPELERIVRENDRLR